MFTLNKDDKSIYATRGDVVFFSVTADDDGVPRLFEPGDVLRMKIYGKKDANAVVLQKDFPVTELTESVEIFLTEEETKIGDVISKPADYWYEIELNPFTYPQTIIGYDDDGPKVFKLFPEGADIPEYVPDPEDIPPVIDAELDLTSARPVENRAIARGISELKNAKNIYYDNTNSGIDAKMVQDAIDLLARAALLGQFDVDFEIVKASPFIQLINTANNRTGEMHYSNAGNLILSSKLDENNLVGIWIKPETEETKDYFDLGTYINGEFTRYPIFGTYNKPRGKYTGTGTATNRIVTIGGIGTTLKISTTKGMAIITGAGAICKKYDSTEVYGLTADQCNFNDGVLMLATADDVVNGARDYYYEAL